MYDNEVRLLHSMKQVLLFCLLAIGVSECIAVPLPSRVTIGYKFSKEALAFLDDPNTTRQEVVSALGAPLIEIRDPGVLVYVWEVTERSYLIPISEMFPGNSEVVNGPAQEWSLFIAYDRTGHVCGHDVRKLNTGELRKAALEWRRNRKK